MKSFKNMTEIKLPPPINNKIDGKLLSVIIPTYNMERYLGACLASLALVDEAQMNLLDILIINDGSTDRSSEIAHDFARRHPLSVRVVDKANGNYGSCVNAALPLVRGKYIRILDADDSYYTDNLPDYLRMLNSSDADVVMTDFDYVDTEGKVTKSLAPLPSSFANRTFPIREIPPKAYIMMHHVAFRSSLFDGLGYHQTEGISYTDWEWVFHPMSRVKRVSYYKKPIYRYLVGREGQTVDPAVTVKKTGDEETSLFSQLTVLDGVDEDNEAYPFLLHMVHRRIVYIYSAGINRLSTFDLDRFDRRLRVEHPKEYRSVEACEVPTGFFGMGMPLVKMWRQVRGKRKMRRFWRYDLFLVACKLGIIK